MTNSEKIIEKQYGLRGPSLSHFLCGNLAVISELCYQWVSGCYKVHPSFGQFPCDLYFNTLIFLLYGCRRFIVLYRWTSVLLRVVCYFLTDVCMHNQTFFCISPVERAACKVWQVRLNFKTFSIGWKSRQKSWRSLLEIYRRDRQVHPQLQTAVLKVCLP